MGKENKKGLFDRAKRRLLHLFVGGLSLAPMANANATTAVPKDNVKAPKIEHVDYTHYKRFIQVNEGDSVLTTMKSQSIQLATKDGIKHTYQNEYSRDDALDNGYTMVHDIYQRDKNGKCKDYDKKITLHTPDGREVDCSFLNKFEFTLAHECTNVETGEVTITTEEQAKHLNDRAENKAQIEIIKRIQNPQDRDAVKQYVHRRRMDAENTMKQSRDLHIKSFAAKSSEHLMSNAKKVRNTTREFKADMKNQVKSFER